MPAPPSVSTPSATSVTSSASLWQRPPSRAAIHAVGLVLGTFVLFSHGFLHEFTNWDDPAYILDNPTVHSLSFESVATAFSSYHVLNYNPLHIVSYSIDHALWGLEPAGFFLTNLLLHAVSGVLVYLLAKRWLKSSGASLFVAALFVAHPTRVESVAWLSQRKDVLSACFVLGSLLLYLRSFDVETDSRRSRRAGALIGSWVLFVLACLSKSQVIGFPLLLLAIDLQRRRPLSAALLGKLPWLVVSAVFAWVTLSAHSGESKHGIVFPDCVLAPLASLPRYLVHSVWPVGLSPYYDFPPGTFLEWPILLAGAGIAVSLVIVARRSWSRDRMAIVAIAWFLAFTLPVLGVVKINVRIADRYLYLSIIGASIAVTRWALLRWEAAGRPRPRSVAALCAGVVGAFGVMTMLYVPVYRDSEALWTRVLEVSPGSSLGHSNIGHHFLAEGRVEKAIEHYDADLAEAPVFESSILGRAYLHDFADEPDEARQLFERALELRPDSVKARRAYFDFLDRQRASGQNHDIRDEATPAPAGTRSEP